MRREEEMSKVEESEDEDTESSVGNENKNRMEEEKRVKKEIEECKNKAQL